MSSDTHDRIEHELFAPALDRTAEAALDAKLGQAFGLGAISTPLAAVAVVLVLSVSEAWRDGYLPWLAAMLLAALVQWQAHRVFAGANSRFAFRQLAVLAQLAVAAGWGTLPLVLMPTTTESQALMLAGLLGLLASSVPFAAPVRTAAFAFLAVLGATASVGFALNTTGQMRYSTLIMALSCLFYMALAVTVHQTFREAALLTAELEHRAGTDPLTGARNRRSFARELQARLEASDDVAVAFLDLDGFKAVNDGFGHDVGDELLIRVAERLAAVATPSTVARIGGDEFIVLSADGEDPHAFGERILAQFVDPFVLASTTVRLGCSVGVATNDVLELQHQGETAASELVKAADMAQLEGKRSGGARVVVAGA